MNYVPALDVLGGRLRQLPCWRGEGAPTASTEGAVGELYLDTKAGELYQCIAVSNGEYIWKSLLGNIDSALDSIIAMQNELLGGDI